MPIELAAGKNFIPNRMRYKLPVGKSDNSVYLLSNSYEYDIEIIKSMPPPKTEYRKIIFPYKVIDKIETRPFRFIKSQNENVEKIRYIQSQKLIPNVIPVQFPYPPQIKDNLYISMSELIKYANTFIRYMSKEKIQNNIFDLFMKFFNKFPYSRNKTLIIDTARYPLFQTLTMETYRTDLVNALLTAYMFAPEEKIKNLPLVIVFKSEEADYKMDLNIFDKRDVQRMRTMLKAIGKKEAPIEKEVPNTSNDEEPSKEELKDELDSIPDNEQISDDNTPSDKKSDETATEKDIEKAADELSSINKQQLEIDKAEEELSASDNDTEEVQRIHASNRSASGTLKAKLAALTTKIDDLANGIDPTQDIHDETKSLYNSKMIKIQAELHRRAMGISDASVDEVSPEMQSPLVDALTGPLKNSPVEANIMAAAAKNAAANSAPVNEESVNATTTSPRELQIRKMVGQIKLNNVTFDTLASKVDAPLPAPVTPNKITTTNPGSQKGSVYAGATKEYEDKLMDRDIAAVFMNLSSLPNGFYVTNIEVNDISDCNSLLNNWKITLRNKNTERQSIINIKVPKVINGRFYNNGIWYNIGKQDFPIPVLKINKKKVIITSNYQKITVERYDTKSLVDISMLVNIINKTSDDKGRIKYIEPGSSVSTNAKYISTIEYDEYAKRWKSFVNKEMHLEMYFNRDLCIKRYEFVQVAANEFCCGMINKVPIVVNTETGLTRDKKTLTDIMVSSLPSELQTAYYKVKPGKLSMYSQIIIGCTIPMGVAIAAWEGLGSLIKKSNSGAIIVDKHYNQPGYFTIVFKDKALAIPNTTQNQLIFNGFYRIPTKAHNIGEFEIPIMDHNSIYVDIFNQQFFKQYSQLTTFITYYQFFVDPITKEVALHYNIPDDIAGMLIYASNLLADNNCSSEIAANLYRIRSSEIIPAIIHYRLAFAISKYNNSTGSKSRNASIVFNPNEVINELLDVPNVEPMSALNPIVELHMRETITKKGFSGVNDDRAFTLDKRSYEDSMIGKIAMSSPNSGNVGISRQLVADPKIESCRGYTSSKGPDEKYNDLELASFSELLTPGTVTRDDSIRTAIATSQTGHIVPTADAQPVLISNGVDEIVPAYMTDEFSVIAEEDGKVIDIDDGFMIVQYKSNKKRAIEVGHRQSFNSGSGFYIDNKLKPALNVGDSFKKNDVLAYHEQFFSQDIDGVVRMNIGPLAKVAFTGIYATYEDAGIVTEKMSKRLATKLSMCQEIKLHASDDIEKIVKPGDEVEIEDPLVTFGLGDTGDKSVDNFLRAFQMDANGNNTFLDKAKRTVNAEHAGRVVMIKMYTNQSLDKLSPSLRKLLEKHFQENIKKRAILDKHDGGPSSYKMGLVYEYPTEPIKAPTIKGRSCDVLIEVYIEHEDEAGIGDKCAAYGANKQIISEVVPPGLEPYSESDPNEEISVFVAPASILKRMIPSVVILAAANKVLVNLKRQIGEMWKQDESKFK